MKSKLFDEVPFREQVPRRALPSRAGRQTPAELRAESRRIKQLQREDGGKDGTVMTGVHLRVSGQRTTVQSVRCRPGSFEWRYGRQKQGALFHAGSQFAQMWERAGATVASSADFLRGTQSGFATGLAEGRAAAMQQLRGIVERLGQAPTDRLIAYCVKGETTTEMAHRHDVAERVMGAVLALDLKACAQALRFAS